MLSEVCTFFVLKYLFKVEAIKININHLTLKSTGPIKLIKPVSTSSSESGY
jgi:hypothetical protein